MAREFAKSFYKSKSWQNTRDYVMVRDHYSCVRCGAPASDVHHIIYLTPENINDYEISLNPDNLICLCKDCHNKEHHAEKYETECIFDEDGNLINISPV